MKNYTTFILILITFFLTYPARAQDTTGKLFSAVNPAFFKYEETDVYIKEPIKHNSGIHVIDPDKTTYPWDDQWNNGYPNLWLDQSGNLSLYFTITTRVASPSSDVGIAALKSNISTPTTWERPSLDVFYWDSSKPVGQRLNRTGGTQTNVIADKIEGLGIFKENNSLNFAYFDGKSSSTSYDGTKLYGYKTTNSSSGADGLQELVNGNFQNTRLTNQKTFTFPFIQGNTHDQIYKNDNGNYYYSARHRVVNPSQSSHRYRRVILGDLGTSFASKSVDMLVGLDSYSDSGQPYSLQAHKLKGFEKDIFFGYVTVYTGDVGATTNDDRQHAELAISNDGKHWKWLRAGIPFISNGAGISEADFGTINIATPIINTNNKTELFYYYFSSEQKHSVSHRQSGLSYAIGDFGKMAGLEEASNSEKLIYSPTGLDASSYENVMPTYNLANAFRLGQDPYPYILADISPDVYPNNFVDLSLYAYDSTKHQGTGDFLTSSYGIGGSEPIDTYQASGAMLTTEVLGKYITVNTLTQSRLFLMKYFVKYAKATHPSAMTKLSEISNIKTVLKLRMKNAVFYGFAFNPNSPTSVQIINDNGANFYVPDTQPAWSFYPSGGSEFFNGSPADCQTTIIPVDDLLPNQIALSKFTEGTFAIKVTPNSNPTENQYIFGMYGDSNNNLQIYLGGDGNYHYKLRRDSTDFIDLQITPHDLNLLHFGGEQVELLIEATNSNKYKNNSEQIQDGGIVTSFTVKTSNNSHTEQLRVIFPSTPSNSQKAQSRINSYNLFSSFVPGLTEIKLAGDQNCNHGFTGHMQIAEMSSSLPVSSSTDFYGHTTWSNPNNTTRSSKSAEEAQEEIEEIEDILELVVAPNPSTTNLNFSFDLSKSQQVRIEIIDLNGKIISVLEDTTLGKGGYNYRVSVENFLSGVYVLRLQTEEGIKTKKIIIKN